MSRSASPAAPAWACRHGGRPGGLDESARRLSHEELAVARALVAEGHQVRSVAEQRAARTADLLACGTTVEVKSFLPGGGRRKPPSPQSVANKLLDARGQGSVAVLWAVGSGLTQARARQGFAMFAARVAEEGAGRLRAARVIGDGFDIRLRLAPAVAAPRPAPGSPGVRAPGVTH